MSVKYMLVHCKHNGCNEPGMGELNNLFNQVTLNPPKVFIFDDKEKANEFFYEYMNDVDVIDRRCKTGDTAKHVPFCSCGIIEHDDAGDTCLYYNKLNQIFLLEQSATVLMTPQDTRISINNANLTHKLVRNCKRMDREQRDAYIILGKMCQGCNESEPVKHENIVEQLNVVEKQEVNVKKENVVKEKVVKEKVVKEKVVKEKVVKEKVVKDKKPPDQV